MSLITRKTCPVCCKDLGEAAFNGSAQAPDGLARICRACTNARRRERDSSKDGRPDPTTNCSGLAAALPQGDIKAVRMLQDAGMIPHWSWVCETLRGGHLTRISIRSIP